MDPTQSLLKGFLVSHTYVNTAGLGSGSSESYAVTAGTNNGILMLTVATNNALVLELIGGSTFTSLGTAATLINLNHLVNRAAKSSVYTSPTLNVAGSNNYIGEEIVPQYRNGLEREGLYMSAEQTYHVRVTSITNGTKFSVTFLIAE